MGEELSMLFDAQRVEKALDWGSGDRGSSLTWLCFKLAV